MCGSRLGGTARACSALAIACLASGCGSARSVGVAAAAPPAEAAPEPAAIRFRDVTADCGIRFRWKRPHPGPLTNLESFGHGCAFFDSDNDGWQDVLLVDEPAVALYRNEAGAGGGRRMRDVTLAAGLAAVRGPWKGCAVGDWDGDGDLDLLLTGYHAAALLKNDGGRFRDATATSGIRHRDWASSAAFADYDGDGDLDVFVGNYVEFGPGSIQHCTFRGGARGGCPPQVYPAELGVLYRNDGDGRFRDVSRQTGIDRSSGKTLAIGWCDFDDDGDQDLYLANDGTPGNLYQNDGGRFTDVGIMTGTAFGVNHLAQAGMGVDWADYNRDGTMDLVVTAFSDESYSLYRNDGGVFENVSRDLGVAGPTFKLLGFGCRFFDADNDGWVDLVFANGHVYDQAEKIDPRSPYRQPLLLMQSERGRRFRDVSAEAGPALKEAIVGRGLAAGDYDDDGRVDLLVVDNEGSPLLLRNESEGAGRFVRLRLAAPGQRDPFAYGARVRLETSDGVRVADVQPGNSYLSSSDPRLCFGLGRSAEPGPVTVRWPDGLREAFPPPAVGRETVLRRGGGSAGARRASR